MRRQALQDPRFAQQAMACVAIDYCGSGQWGRAILPLLQACMEPAEWAYHALLARALTQLGRNDLAVSFLQYGLRRQPDHSQLCAVYRQAAGETLPQVPMRQEALATQSPVITGIAIDAVNGGVDILVPVYGRYQHTRRCLESLIQTQPLNCTPATIIVLDDAGQDQILNAYLKQLAEAGQIQLHRHAENLGFIDNINYGMRLNPTHDVVWVNSDTHLHGNWLDRLKTAVESQPKVASVTPWSNNGELLSLTESQINEAMPSLQALADIDQTVAELALKPVEIPGGCGFCFFIPRAAINDVGYLNSTDLKRGYGEETEWSMRARQKGWVHLAATDMFVAHEGGASFGLEKALRVYQNNGWIRQTYPDIDDWFETHPGTQGLSAARLAIQTARLPSLVAWARDQKAKLVVMPEFLAAQLSASDPPKPAVRLSYRQQPEGLAVVIAAPLNPGWRLCLSLPAEGALLQAVLDALSPALALVSLSESLHLLPPALQPYLAGLPGVAGAAMAEALKSDPIPPLDTKQLTGKTWLIADRLNDPALLQQWLRLTARFGQQHIASETGQTLFCFVEPGEHAHALRATGAAYQLPRLEGLSIHEQIKLANIQGAITLAQAAEQCVYPQALADYGKLSLKRLKGFDN